MPDDVYRVKLSIFEGPIDLLLYLIKKNELDIHEISLSGIISEYLEYVELIKLLDLEKAGDFIVVASALMKIKSRSLFTSHEDGTEGEGMEDPRQSLINYLLEYEKFGDVAEKLAEKESVRRSVFPRGGEKSRIADYLSERTSEPDYMLFDLLSALRDVLKTASRIKTHEVELFNVTSEMKQQEIMEALDCRESLDFIEMIHGKPKIIIVVTFIALLELIKKRAVRVQQAKQFGRIMILRRMEDESEDS